MHTIAWSVTDSGGYAEGIGSRYFHVNNSGVQQAPRTKKVQETRASARDGVWVRTGWNPDAPLQLVEGSEIDVNHGGRMELHLPAGVESVLFDGSAALPLGATFRDGVFYWQLEPAYSSQYELRFLDSAGMTMYRYRVSVMLAKE
jgi:hypothetical protein